MKKKNIIIAIILVVILIGGFFEYKYFMKDDSKNNEKEKYEITVLGEITNDKVISFDVSNKNYKLKKVLEDKKYAPGTVLLNGENVFNSINFEGNTRAYIIDDLIILVQDGGYVAGSVEIYTMEGNKLYTFPKNNEESIFITTTGDEDDLILKDNYIEYTDFSDCDFDNPDARRWKVEYLGNHKFSEPKYIRDYVSDCE